MKNKVYSIFLLQLVLSVFGPMYLNADTIKKYRISEVANPDKIFIGGSYMHKGDEFKETDVIDWRDKKQTMKVVLVGSTEEYIFNRRTMREKDSDNLKTYFLRMKAGASLGTDDIEYTKNSIQGQKRLALVIGNSNYITQSPLQNPIPDADAIAEALLLKGFNVIEKTDLDINSLRQAIQHFNNLLVKDKYDVALFYYAGHGTQVDYVDAFENHDRIDYIVPVEADLKEKGQIKNTCYRFNNIVEVLGNNSRLQNIIIFDACRDVKENYERSTSAGWRAPNDYPGTCILYSTKAGRKAFDGTGLLSPFAKAFLTEINIPNQSWGTIQERITWKLDEEIGQQCSPHGVARKEFVFYPREVNLGNQKQNSSSLNKIPEKCIVTLTQDWEEYSSPNSQSFKGFKSKGNKNISNSEAILSFTIKGYKAFSFYIRSNGESPYDYIIVGDLDRIPTRFENYTNTKDIANSGTSLTSYKTVTFNNLDFNREYTINVSYTKDGTNSMNEDCGYVLLPSNAEIKHVSSAEKQKSSSNLSYNFNGHNYVDLGLPSGNLWATCNVGASTPEAYGDYYSWGEVSPKNFKTDQNLSYTWESHKYRQSGDSWDNLKLSKYVLTETYGTVDNKSQLDLSDDAAHVNWGGDWRLPSHIDWMELHNYCIWKWVEHNGHYGYEVIGRNNNKIFLPAAGYIYKQSRLGDEWGHYLSSSLHPYKPYLSCFNYICEFCWSSITSAEQDERYHGSSVRAIIRKTSQTPDIKLNTDKAIQISTGYQNGVKYINGHPVVDLGLSINWSTCNVGTNIPEDAGNRYSWGETKPTVNYSSFSTYKFNSETKNVRPYMSKYCTSDTYGIKDNKTQLELTDDVAHTNWGGNWRIPTHSEWQELRENCTWTIAVLNGVNGYKITSKIPGYTNNYIFLPVNTAGSGAYWSSSLVVDFPYDAYCLYLAINSNCFSLVANRFSDYHIRPVCNK